MRLSRAKSKALLTGIGSAIRRRRQELGMTQSAVAQTAGIHTNVIGRTERGTYNPTIMTLVAIASALKMSLVDLLPGR